MTMFSRRAFWWGGGALAAAAALGAAAPRAWAWHRGDAMGGGFGGFGHRHGMGRLFSDPEQAKEKAGLLGEWVLKSVDGTPEQKEQVRRITDRLVDELQPLAERHREQREAFGRELSKPSIDRAELERLRQGGLQLADEASRVAIAALGDVADVLKPEQRAELLEWAQRFHER
jgi:Spy/CpxP family protein refolding chaperone